MEVFENGCLCDGKATIDPHMEKIKDDDEVLYGLASCLGWNLCLASNVKT